MAEEQQDTGASSLCEDRATAAEPVVSALRDGIPSAQELGRRCAEAITPALFEDILRKTTDDLYIRLMEEVQDWLCDNAEQNISSRVENAERWARELRKELYDLDAALGIGDRFVPRAQRVADLVLAESERGQLIYAVASKHEGETRFETALRYIREREQPSGDAAQGIEAATAGETGTGSTACCESPVAEGHAPNPLPTPCEGHPQDTRSDEHG
jgi:hypothetical protein